MGGKGKKKKKGDDGPKEPPKIIIPDYTPKDLQPLPISVKVKHLKDIYIIYTDEYHKSIEIKEKLSNLTGIAVEDIKLYLENRRPVEDQTINHDQQIENNTVIYPTYKNVETEEGKILFEKINDVLKDCGVVVKPNNNPDKPPVATAKTQNQNQE